MAAENVVVDNPVIASADKPAAKPDVPDQTPKPDASTREPKPVQKDTDDARYKGLVADLQKERKARQALEAKGREWETTLEAERRRVRALAGVETLSPEDAEAQAIRERFAQIYPELAGLTAEDITALRELRTSKQDIDTAVRNHWDRHVASVTSQLEDLVADAIGVDLTDRQKRNLLAAYAHQVQNDPEFAEAYERGDKAHLEQFVKDFVDDWFKPAQRRVTANELDRQRRVPSGRDRSVAQQPEKKIDVTNNDAVNDLLVEGFKSRGGEFGRKR